MVRLLQIPTMSLANFAQYSPFRLELWVGNVCKYGVTKLPDGSPALSTDYPGLSGKEFPDLLLNKGISVKRGRLEFTAKSQKVVIDFLAHHEDISRLKYVPAP